MGWIHRLLVFIAVSFLPALAVLCIFEGPRTTIAAFFSERWRELTLPQVLLVAVIVAFYGFMVIWTGRDWAKVRRDRYKTKLQELYAALARQFERLATVRTLDAFSRAAADVDASHKEWCRWLLNNMGDAALNKYVERGGLSLHYNWSAEGVEGDDVTRRSNLMDAVRVRRDNVQALLDSDKFDPVKPPPRRTWLGRKIPPREIQFVSGYDDAGKAA